MSTAIGCASCGATAREVSLWDQIIAFPRTQPLVCCWPEGRPDGR